jgi:DNA repair protein RadC
MSVSTLRLATSGPRRRPVLAAPQSPPEAALASDEDLLTIIAGDAGDDLWRRFGSLAAALGGDRYELRRIGGPDLAWTFAVFHECARRMGRASLTGRTLISSYAAMVVYLTTTMAWRGREQFRVLFLDTKNHLIVDEVMNEGTVDHAPVYPREVVRRALEVDAAAVILVHNHPSGDPAPSPADIDMTRQVVAAGRALKITVHDHIIVGRDGFASLKALGLV